jgi:hypothetical protein
MVINILIQGDVFATDWTLILIQKNGASPAPFSKHLFQPAAKQINLNGMPAEPPLTYFARTALSISTCFPAVSL